MKTTRIDRVTALTRDADAASATFRRIFGLQPVDSESGPPDGAAGSGEPGDDVRVLAIGGAEIAFVRPAAGTELAEALTVTGEGMAALHLEVADVDTAIRDLERAGIEFGIVTRGSRRVIHVEPIAAHGVRLSLIGPA